MFNKRITAVFWLAGLTAIFFSVQTFATDEYEEYKRKKNAEFQQLKRQQSEKYRKLKDRQEAEYQRHIKEIEQKWSQFIGSTESRWVNYSDDKKTRSIVNFKDKTDEQEKETETIKATPGQIVIEAVVSVQESDAVNKAKKQIAAQAKKLFSPDNDAKRNLLEEQVKTENGETVTAQNVEEFVEEEVLPEAKIDPEPLKSEDGIERIKVSVTIPMVPNHLRIRAEQYLPTARKQCEQYDIDLPLVMAIIQTESHFDPLAVSHADAHGLMQIVTRNAGKEVYRVIFNREKTPSATDLYDPENNLMFGVAYLQILRDRYLSSIADREKQEYLMIAAYNGGIGRVRNRVLKKYSVQNMSLAKLFKTLKRVMPKETGDYLEKVTSRKNNYIAWQ